MNWRKAKSEHWNNSIKVPSNAFPLEIGSKAILLNY